MALHKNRKNNNSILFSGTPIVIDVNYRDAGYRLKIVHIRDYGRPNFLGNYSQVPF